MTPSYIGTVGSTGQRGTSKTSESITGGPATAGHLVIVGVATNGSTSSDTYTFSDDHSGSWSGNNNASRTGMSQRTAWQANCGAVGQITAAWVTATNADVMEAFEFAGVATSSPLDASSGAMTASSTGPTGTTGTTSMKVTTVTAGCLLVAWVAIKAGTSQSPAITVTEDTGWTQIPATDLQTDGTSTGIRWHVAYKVAGAAGDYTYHPVFSSSVNWTGWVDAFKPAASGPLNVTDGFTSAGVGASTFAVKAKRRKTFTSSGVAVSSMSLADKRRMTFSSSGTGTDAFAAHQRRKKTFTSAGAATDTFTLHLLPRMHLQSAGVATTTFRLGSRRRVTMASAGAATDSFAVIRRRPLAMASAGVATDTLTLRGRHRLAAWTSVGVGADSFAVHARRPRSFASGGSGASTFAVKRKHRVTMRSDGVGGTNARATRFVRTTFVSHGVASSTFPLRRRHALVLASAGVGTTVFAGRPKRRGVFASAGVGTSTFARKRRGALTFTSIGASSSVTIRPRVRRRMQASSSGYGIDYVRIGVRRREMMVSRGIGGTLFQPRKLATYPAPAPRGHLGGQVEPGSVYPVQAAS